MLSTIFLLMLSNFKFFLNFCATQNVQTLKHINADLFSELSILLFLQLNLLYVSVKFDKSFYRFERADKLNFF